MKINIVKSKVDYIQNNHNIGILWYTGEKSVLSIDSSRYVRATNTGTLDFSGIRRSPNKREYCRTVLEADEENKIYLFSSLEEMMIWYFNKNAL